MKKKILPFYIGWETDEFPICIFERISELPHFKIKPAIRGKVILPTSLRENAHLSE